MDTSPSKQQWWTRQRVRLVRLLMPLALIVVVGASSGCVTTGTNPISGNKRAYAYSWEEEVKLGTEADKQIQQQYGIYENKELQQYVDRVAQKVLAESHMRRPDAQAKFRNTEFTFRVLDSPIINAFALPGGYVYVTRGLLAHLNNEAQLAVVLGHEIGHVAGRHASKQAAKQQFMQGLLVGGAVAGQVAFGGNVGENVLGLGGSAAQLLSLSYSRGNERESDQLGVEYATMAGYDAAEGAEFFTSLKRKQKQSLLRFYREHCVGGESASGLHGRRRLLPPRPEVSISRAAGLEGAEPDESGGDDPAGSGRLCALPHLRR